MSDQGFREIQLNFKQVVFLFVLGAVALVGVFLLGVSVGRGVSPSEVTAQATPTPTEGIVDAGPPAKLPPATTPVPGERQYQQTLQEKVPSKSTPATPSTPSPTPAAPTPTAAAKPASTPATADAVWYVVVNSFSTATNAAKQVSELKAKDITATTFDAPGSGAHFKVRVGPLDRAAADAMRARLQKLGYKPSVIR